MAATYRPIDAFKYAKTFIKKMPLDDVQLRILDHVNKAMWMAAPWRWTIGSLPIITFAANTQDYSVSLPADFLYGLTAYSTEQNDKTPRAIHIEPHLPTGGLVGQPSRMALLGAAGTTGTARFLPKPGSIPSPAPIVITQYKKMAPVLTPANIFAAGTLLFDDEWSYVYEAGVLWLAYLYADDSRAGTINFDSRGQYAFTGQRAIFETNLMEMRQREKLLIIDAKTAPEATLEK